MQASTHAISHLSLASNVWPFFACPINGTAEPTDGENVVYNMSMYFILFYFILCFHAEIRIWKVLFYVIGLNY